LITVCWCSYISRNTATAWVLGHSLRSRCQSSSPSAIYSQASSDLFQFGVCLY
jgi:hypothetical protein